MKSWPTLEEVSRQPLPTGTLQLVRPEAVWTNEGWFTIFAAGPGYSLSHQAQLSALAVPHDGDSCQPTILRRLDGQGDWQVFHYDPLHSWESWEYTWAKGNAFALYAGVLAAAALVISPMEGVLASHADSH